MFVSTKYSGYNRHGEQSAAGYFLILMQPKYEGPAGVESVRYTTSAPIRGIVRYVRMKQFGHFMMGSARIGKHRITLSGSYGSDGLPCTVPLDAYNQGIEIPQELYEAWKNGNGWNGAGSEAKLMREWALNTFPRKTK